MGTMDHQSSISSDTNNNNTTTMTSIANCKKNEKYSLRKRHKRGTTQQVEETMPPADDHKRNFVRCLGQDRVSAATTTAATASANRNSKQHVKKEPSKAKTKAAPLSKYRRKTANARERTRMREINSAFETLRNCVPTSVIGTPAPESPTNEKLTKITTLRLAMRYITLLSDCLSTNKTDLHSLSSLSSLISAASSSSSSSSSSNHTISDNRFHSNHHHPHHTNNVIVKPVVKPTKSPRVKKSSKKSSLPPPAPPPQKSALLNTCNLSSSSSSATSLNEDIFNSYQKYLDSDFLDSASPSPSLYHDCHTSSLPSTSSDSNDLEFGLLLESDGESLQFSEPCLSPLAPLDVLSPFSDILSPSFSAQTTLDMYLT